MGVVTMQPQEAVLTAELPGRTLPYEVSDVRPQVNGILKARMFTEGAGSGRPAAVPDRRDAVPGRVRAAPRRNSRARRRRSTTAS